MSEKPKFTSIVIRSFIGSIIGMLLNVALFYVASSNGWITDIIIPNTNKPLEIASVIFASLVPTTVAGFLYAVFTRFVPNAYKFVAILVSFLIILSFISPYTIPNVPLSMFLSLDLMHLISGVIFLISIKVTK
jgi:hypothetical protein